MGINNQLINDLFPQINLLPIVKKYQYRVFTEEYLDQVIDVFTRSFCRSEPMTEYLKMDEDKYKNFAKAVSNKAIEDQLSIIILDQNKVAALALVEDIADPGPIPEFDPKFRFILGLLDKIGIHLFENRVFPKKHLAHLFITAVDENYRKLHLSTIVNLLAIQQSHKSGFDFMYCEMTNHLNESGLIPHLDNLDHWKEKIGTQVYREFEMENQKPFEFLDGSANSYLWKLHNDAKLTYSKK